MHSEVKRVPSENPKSALLRRAVVLGRRRQPGWWSNLPGCTILDRPEPRNAEAAFRRPRALLTKQQGDWLQYTDR
jgi:hypothetical protein